METTMGRFDVEWSAPTLICCACGEEAEGNVSCADGEVCDACHESGEPNEDEKRDGGDR